MIDAVLRRRYGATAPLHFAVELPAALGGPDPLPGISVYASESFGRPHWHYVTYGFTELYGKETDDPEISGYGFELTFRLARGDEAEPPGWVLGRLQDFARYVFQTGATYQAGDFARAKLGERFVAAGFVEDPELAGVHASPHGAFSFLQVVALTDGELEAARTWSGSGTYAAMAERLPGLITDPARPSLTDDPAFVALIAQGKVDDGAAAGLLIVPGLVVTSARATIPAQLVPGLLDAASLAFASGRPLTLADGEQQLVLAAGEWAVDRGPPVTLTLPAGEQLSELLAGGESRWAGFELTVR